MRIYKVIANVNKSDGYGPMVTLGHFMDLDEAYQVCKGTSTQGEDGDILFSDIPDAGMITNEDIFNLTAWGTTWYPAYQRRYDFAERRIRHVWIVDKPASAG